MYRTDINKGFLIHEYIDEEKTIKQIAFENQVSVGLIFNRLHDYKIQTRPVMTDRTRQRLSSAKMGRASTQKGKRLSTETRKKISESHKGMFRIHTKYGGHKKKRADGYIAIYCPSHKRASKEGYVLEHILVAEEAIGRSLAPDEVVHHKNRIRDDNRVENLQVMTKHDHISYHMKERHRKRRNDLLTA